MCIYSDTNLDVHGKICLRGFRPVKTFKPGSSATEARLASAFNFALLFENSDIDTKCILLSRQRKIMNNNEKFRSFKRKENIHKKEVGPYRGVGY